MGLTIKLNKLVIVTRGEKGAVAIKGEEIIESQIQKNKLDFELVRALKCAELQQKGFTLLPGSRVYHICSDVVPIQSLLQNNVSNP